MERSSTYERNSHAHLARSDEQETESELHMPEISWQEELAPAREKAGTENKVLLTYIWAPG